VDVELSTFMRIHHALVTFAALQLVHVPAARASARPPATVWAATAASGPTRVAQDDTRGCRIIRDTAAGVVRGTSRPRAGPSSRSTDDIPFAPLVRPSRYWIGWPRGEMYEGDVSIPVHLWSRTACLTHLVVASVTPSDSALPIVSRGRTLTFVPRFVIRQAKGGSSPVRSPSFNPGFEYTEFRLQLQPMDSGLNTRFGRSDLFGRAPERGRWGLLAAGRLALAHYSNGQAGCLYRTQSLDPVTDQCLGRGESVGDLNLEDGSFSSHYVDLDLTGGLLRFDARGSERTLFALSVGARAYPGGWVSRIGGMDRELADAYGRHGLGARVEFRRRDRRTLGSVLGPGIPTRSVKRLMSEVECSIGRADGSRPCRGRTEASIAFPYLYGLGVVAKYVYGYDHYNIAFGRSIGNPRAGWPVIGIVLDHSRAITITEDAARQEARTSAR
jgi:hypothetical protein